MSETIINYPCSNCGHSDRMHRKLDGCMVKIVLEDKRGRGYCPCSCKPDAIRSSRP